MSSSNKISQHKLHSNMLYRPSTAHALYSFDVCTRQTILLCSVATTLQLSTTKLSLHTHEHALHTHDYPPPCLPQPSYAHHALTQNTVGKMEQDVGMVESIVHLVWLVFEGFIPTCACFHSENFFVTCINSFDSFHNSHFVLKTS